MKFKIQNIGFIKNYELELSNLTVICGKNNTGKTYLSYSIFGYLDKLFSLMLFKEFDNFNTIDLQNSILKQGFYSINLNSLEKELIQFYQDYCKKYQTELYEIFNSNPDDFINSKFTIDFNKLKNIENIEFSFDIYNDNGKVVKEKGTENVKLVLGKDEVFLKDISKLNKIFIKSENKESLNKESKYIHDEVINFMIFSGIKAAFFSILFKHLITSVFLISSERTSLQTLQKEIDQYRSRLMQEFQKNKNIDISEFGTSRFSYPIEKQMDFIRNLDKIIKEKSFIADKHPEIIEFIEQMLGVKYEYINNQLMINIGNKLLPHYMVSSSIRSLTDLHFWLKHKASPGALLMIDEPELNLYPENQIKLARLFAKLANTGINVWITTHSDYIIKELNNLLLLSNDFSERENLIKDYGYNTNEILNKNQVKVYISKENGVLQNVKIDNHGMSSTTFDDTIEKINEVSNSIFNLID